MSRRRDYIGQLALHLPVALNAKLMFIVHVAINVTSESESHEDFRCFTLTHFFEWCSECATDTGSFHE